MPTRAMASDRTEAGQKLAARMAPMSGARSLVLAVSAAAIPVAYEIARKLRVPLDVFPARNVGAPGAPEIAIGAVAIGGGRAEDWSIITQRELTPEQVRQLFALEERRLAEDRANMRGDLAMPELAGRAAILVDDAVATGLRMAAAIAAVRSRGPAHLIVATPFCPDPAADRLRCNVDALDRLSASAQPEYRDVPLSADEAARVLAYAHDELGADTVDLYLG